ncbi:hypothetical protein TIFTF001_040796 [Ficus carica]|uniref:Dirigent protein n=1 Tax=Ficus carica TaxID=3494 RepID=A0AA87YYS7_FICCA|nr:hypothetical protein TIFTF001_040796 [Ficus carica]
MSNSKALQKPTFFFLILFLFFFISTSTSSDDDSAHHKTFSRNLSPRKFALRREKLSHLHFYFHDIRGGDKPTAIKVAEAKTSNASRTGFGFVTVIDDPLTVGSERSSKQVGRAQGIYASASQLDLSLLMVLNYVFTEGKFNGSTLSILGRNAIFRDVREMPIVGGSGVFRFARGYAQARTHKLDFKTGDAVVEYNVYVLHF